MRWLIAALVLLATQAGCFAAETVALITGMQGKVVRLDAAGQDILQPFEKLKVGDVVELQDNARLRLVFFSSRSEETWQGSGRLEIEARQAKGSKLPAPQIRILPEVIVRQIAKTPGLATQQPAGSVRLRSIAAADTVSRIEDEYARMRQESAADDLNPEIFLLAGMFEARQYDRVDTVLAQMTANHPGNFEVTVLKSLYRKAMQDAKPVSSK